MTNNVDIEIDFFLLKNGLLWPHCNNIKALSASRLTHFIREIEFQEIPEKILKAAAERGKFFHQTIQDYFKTGKYPDYIDSQEKKKDLNKLELRLLETITFFKKRDFFHRSTFRGIETLHYSFYNNELIAAYSDLDFENFILELKTSSWKKNISPSLTLVFEIQLLVQHLCSKKDVYLLWSTGEGIVFSKFQKTTKLLKILNVLIAIVRAEEKKENYSDEEKKEILKKILIFYQPKKILLIKE